MKHSSRRESRLFSITSFGMLIAAAAIGFAPTAGAHHPDKENQPVHQRIDVIGPKGNRLPPSYRFRYNRPRYITGKIAYVIAPSSQEAMAWHRAVHAGAYEKPKKHCRLEQHYFYPKPWEVLTVGPRTSKTEGEPDSADTESLREMLESEPLPETVSGPEMTGQPALESALESALEPTPDASNDLPLIELE